MKIQLCFFLSLTASIATYADTTISVTNTFATSSNPQLNYSNKARLEQVLRDSLSILSSEIEPPKQSLYWPGAALLDMHDASIEQEKLKILNDLNLLSENAQQAALANSFMTLANILKEISLKKRVIIPLDHDLVRIKLELNPMLEGDYQLVLPFRPNSVYILGAVQQAGPAPWQERFSAQAYLEAVRAFPNAENSYAWVIQPDGHVERHPIAKWNELHMDIAPGAIIYLGYGALPSQFTSLNEDIVELLRNKAL